MGDVGVVNVAQVSIIAFFANDLLHLNNFIFTQECVETELRELLGEVVRWDVDKSKERLYLWCWLWRQSQTACNELTTFVLHVLVKNNLVHTFCEIKVNFRQKGGSV